MKIVMKLYYIVAFFVYYLFKLIQANLYVAYDILTPRMRTNPGFIWVDLKINSDLGILLFSNLLSMTPGTLSVDISDDKTQLLVHYLYNNKDNTILNDIEKIQSRVRLLTN